MPREALLVQAMVELADSLVDDFDVIDVLTALSDRCVDALDVTAAGVMLASRRATCRSSPTRVRPCGCLSSSSCRPIRVPAWSASTAEGHCKSRAVDQWRAVAGFHPAGAQRGFRSSTAYPCDSEAGRSVLSICSRQAGALDDRDVLVAQGLADVATIAILQHQAVADAQQLNDQLNLALRSRVIIEQAKGKISESAHLDMDHSFQLLRAHARNHNLRLSELARSVAEGTVLVTDLDPLARRAQAGRVGQEGLSKT